VVTETLLYLQALHQLVVVVVDPTHRTMRVTMVDLLVVVGQEMGRVGLEIPHQHRQAKEITAVQVLLITQLILVLVAEAARLQLALRELQSWVEMAVLARHHQLLVQA
jgi:hypothetical protein